MKRLFLLTLLVQWVLADIGSGADQRIAFERDEAIHIANMDASLIRKLHDGTFPAISPDGKRVAFTTVDQPGGDYVRRIAVIDIASGHLRVFTDVPGENSYHPAWSPDGAWLAFTTMTDGVWNLALTKPDGTEFRFIKKGDQNNRMLFSPCWAQDGKSIFCQDMTHLYRIALDGSIISQWKMDQIIPNGVMSGDSRIDLAPDGHRLLLSVDMNEDYQRKDWDGPVPALWSFDVPTGAAVRLTSRNLFAWDACWLDDADVMFVSQRAGEKTVAIYRTHGKKFQRLIENARRPTVSRPD